MRKLFTSPSGRLRPLPPKMVCNYSGRLINPLALNFMFLFNDFVGCVVTSFSGEKLGFSIIFFAFHLELLIVLQFPSLIHNTDIDILIGSFRPYESM